MLPTDSIQYSMLSIRGRSKQTLRKARYMMNLRISQKKFVCVDYPGIVENHDAMLQTLGGAAKVTAVTQHFSH